MNLKSVIKWRWYQLKIASRPLPLLFYMCNALEMRTYVRFDATEWWRCSWFSSRNRTLETWSRVCCFCLSTHLSWAAVLSTSYFTFFFFFFFRLLHFTTLVSSLLLPPHNFFGWTKKKKIILILKRKQTCNCIISNTNLFIHKWMNRESKWVSLDV